MWNTALIFSNKRHGLRKKLFIEENKIFSVDYVKIIELLVTHKTSHEIWVDEITDVRISMKKINKN